jgi:hypothetical protein
MMTWIATSRLNTRRKLMEINLETGLPELPSGMFWRVEAVNHWGSPWEVMCVHIIERRSVRSQVPVRFWGAFGVQKWVSSDLETTHITQSLWRPGSIPNPSDDDWTLDQDAIRRKQVRATEATPEMILLAAEKAFGRYELKLKSESLIGDYPPKKLTIEEKN